MSAVQQAHGIPGMYTRVGGKKTSTGQDRESERERKEGGGEANEKVNSCQLCFAKAQDMIRSSGMCPNPPNPLLQRKADRCQADRKERAQTSRPSAELAPCKTYITCMWTPSYINGSLIECHVTQRLRLSMPVPVCHLVLFQQASLKLLL